jgi:hypothetical protein
MWTRTKVHGKHTSRQVPTRYRIQALWVVMLSSRVFITDIVKKCTKFLHKEARSTRRMLNTGNRWKHIGLVVRMVKERKAGQSNQGEV